MKKRMVVFSRILTKFHISIFRFLFLFFSVNVFLYYLFSTLKLHSSEPHTPYVNGFINLPTPFILIPSYTSYMIAERDDKNFLKIDENKMKEFENAFHNVIKINCKPNMYILNIINSDPKHRDLRDDIRSLHGNNSHFYNYKFKNGKNLAKFSHCTLFAVGFTENKRLNSFIDREILMKKDILRIPFVEEYRKMAHKILWFTKLANSIDIPYKYLVKSDDDAFINFVKLLPHLYELQRDVHFGGRVIKNSPVDRNDQSQYYMSYSDFNKTMVDVFVPGVIHIINKKIIDCLLREYSRNKIYPMEDIYFTHLVVLCKYIPEDLPVLYYKRGSYDLNYPNSYLSNIGHWVPYRYETLLKYKEEIYS